MKDPVPSGPPADLPLKLLQPIKVGRQGGAHGLLWPSGANMPPALLVDWDGAQFLIPLHGRAALRFLPVRADTSLRGALVAGGEFVVDLTSRYDAVQKNDPLGALVLMDGRAHLSAAAANDGFGDSVLVPLWGEFEPGTEGEAVGFTSWSLVVRHGHDLFELWRHGPKAE